MELTTHSTAERRVEVSVGQSAARTFFLDKHAKKEQLCQIASSFNITSDPRHTKKDLERLILNSPLLRTSVGSGCIAVGRARPAAPGRPSARPAAARPAAARPAAARPSARAACLNDEDLSEFERIPDAEFVMTQAGNCLSRNDARALVSGAMGWPPQDPYTRQPITHQALERLQAFANQGVVPADNRLTGAPARAR